VFNLAKDHMPNLVRGLLVVAFANVLFAQAEYGGPAILARGQGPTAMSTAQIEFRPYLSLTGVYSKGLNGVSVDSTGNPVNDDTVGGSVGVGVSGYHSWKHTSIGLAYGGRFTHYSKSFYDGINSQSLMMSLNHQLSRHAMFSLTNTAVLYGSNQASPSLPQTISYDPSTTNIPTNDFFDNRTFALSTSARLSVQRSTRMSYMVGAQGFLVRRRSSDLVGTTGYGLYGDAQYRLSKRSTIGAVYMFQHYIFTRLGGGTDAHNWMGSYSRTLTRTMQLSGTAGVMHYENLFILIVPIPPAVAAVTGISSAEQRTYLGSWAPTYSGRISKTLSRGMVFAGASQGLNQGNGLFATSLSRTVTAGYSYTGMRHWSITSGISYNSSQSEGNVRGQYGTSSGTVSVSRQLVRATHGVASAAVRKYGSGDFKNYNKWTAEASLGLIFAPGELPIRFW
jgi:hypothetical protein